MKNQKYIFGSEKYYGRYKFVWWGRSQWYKFRWFGDHIDLGMLSIYNLPEPSLFWRIISIIIKPLRVWYHKNYVYSTKAKIKNFIKETEIAHDFQEENNYE